MPISSKLDSPRVLPLPTAQTTRASTPEPASASPEPKSPRFEPFEASRFDEPLPNFVRPDGSIVMGEVLKAKVVKTPQQVLVEQGDEAMKKGHYDEARKAFEAARALPQTPQETVPPGFTKDAGNLTFYKGNTVISAAKATATDSTAVADLKLKQLAHVEEMSKVAGKKPFDPHDMADMRLYFQKFSKGKSTAAVSAEVQRYLKNFYVHVGDQPGTVNWSSPHDDRAKEATKLLSGQPTDPAGRKFINCEAFTFITAAVLKDVKAADGKTPRFDVYATRNAMHEVAVVFDNDSKPKGKRFDVDNSDVTVLPVPIPTAAGRKKVAELRLPPNLGAAPFN